MKLSSAVCKYPGCTWSMKMISRRQSECAAVWHVYEEHNEYWIQMIGDHPPRDPRPEAIASLN